jgi:hypothetical protein
MLPWNAQLLRLTLFARPPIDGAGLWRSVVGAEPEVDEHRPREGIRRQSGQIGEAVLEMGMAPNRLDWVMGPAPAQSPMPGPNIHLGDPRAAIEQFDRLLVPWLPQSGLSIMRIAFGLVAVLPTPDRSNSYARLRELVPSVKYDPDRTREVIYQVNRPIASKSMPGLELNRITTWSALRTGIGTIILSGGNLITTAVGDPQFFARCECDNNTPAERTDILETTQLEPIYLELRNLAIANLERGELA